MKRGSKLFLLLILLVCGCSKKNEEKIIIESTYKIKESISINNNELVDMINDELDFILFCYTDTCTSCSSFESNILNKYIKDNQANIYKIDKNEIKGAFKTTKKYQVNPRIIVFNDGDISSQVNIENDEDIFTDLSSFTNYISENTIISNLVNINYSDIKEIKENNGVIYYGWNSCGDCAYLNSHKMKEYIGNPNYGKIYYYETDEVRDGGANWQAFLDYSLINLNNNNGKVPTIIKYNSSGIEDYVIYFNDIIEIDNDGKVKVINTSYNEEGSIIGLEFENYNAYLKGVEEYHSNKLEIFMNKYLKIYE